MRVFETDFGIVNESTPSNVAIFMFKENEKNKNLDIGTEIEVKFVELRKNDERIDYKYLVKRNNISRYLDGEKIITFTQI